MNGFKKKRQIEILIAEDNPGDVRLTKEVLREAKLINRLSVVEDGVEALKFLRKEDDYVDSPSPDLILLDINLPKKNGIEVLKEIKEDPVLKRIPTVILTSSSEERDVSEAYSLHANCYITKPVDFEQFIRVARSINEFWFSIVTLPDNQ